MKTIFSILLKLAGGFLLYASMFAAFLHVPTVAAKLGILAIFLVLAAVPLLVDLCLTRFCHWTWDLGIVFFSAAAFSSFMIVSATIILSTAEMPKELELMNEYITGITLIMLFGGLGGLMLMSHKAEAEQPVQVGV